jgi:hypothetical protein
VPTILAFFVGHGVGRDVCADAFGVFRRDRRWALFQLFCRTTQEAALPKAHGA